MGGVAMATMLEVCVDSPAGVAAAIAGGADRIELCGALELGGVTPSAGLVAAALALVADTPVRLHAMVRPRAGNFAFDRDEIDWAVRDAAWLIAQGVDGLVFGAARDGRVDEPAVAAWRAGIAPAAAARSGPVSLTFHRAIDTVADPVAAVDTVVAHGFDRILTSGGATAALAGVDTLRAMVARAAGRCVVMAGAGVRPDTVVPIVQATGVAEVHASASRAGPAPSDPQLVTLGFEIAALRYTDATTVRQIKMMLDSMTNLIH